MIIKMSSTIKSWQHWHITAFTPFDNDTHRTSQWKMSWFICAELMIKQINPLLGLAKITSFFFVCRTFMTTRQVMFMLVAVMMMLLVLAPYMLKGLILESQGLATQLVCHKQDILSRKSFIVWPSVPPLISLWTKLFTKKVLSRPFKENEYNSHFYENLPDNHENMHFLKQIFCNDFLKCLYHRAIIL